MMAATADLEARKEIIDQLGNDGGYGGSGGQGGVTRSTGGRGGGLGGNKGIRINPHVANNGYRDQTLTGIGSVGNPLLVVIVQMVTLSHAHTIIPNLNSGLVPVDSSLVQTIFHVNSTIIAEPILRLQLKVKWLQKNNK